MARYLLLALILAATAPHRASAYNALMAWSPVTGTAGYKVYVRQGTALYGSGTDIGAIAPDPDGVVRYTASGLPLSQVSYFVVTSYDAAATESAFSNELSLLVTATPTATYSPTPTATLAATSTPVNTSTAIQGAIYTSTPPAAPSYTSTPTLTPTIVPTTATTPTTGTYNVQMAWSPVTGIAGYKIYVRQGTAAYGAGLDVGAQASGSDGIVRYTKTGLPLNQTSYFVVTSYDAAGKESAFSNELSLFATATPAPSATPTTAPPIAATTTPGGATPTPGSTGIVPPTSTVATTPTRTPTQRPTNTPVRTTTSTPTTTPTATPSPSVVDLTGLGTITVRVKYPTGVGNKNPEVIRDGDMPQVGSSDPTRQYDTYDGANTANTDWIGYRYTNSYVFSEVVFQEGMQFWDGGWFDSLTVQVHRSGKWVSVAALQISPAYPGNNGINYETFVLRFTPMLGDGIRIYGKPGGINEFISVGELRIHGSL